MTALVLFVLPLMVLVPRTCGGLNPVPATKQKRRTFGAVFFYSSGSLGHQQATNSLQLYSLNTFQHNDVKILYNAIYDTREAFLVPLLRTIRLFKNLGLLLIVLFQGVLAHTQSVNAYARVTAINGDTLTIANVEQTNGNFEVGQLAIVMQMQDDVIGSNTSNNTSFGNLGSIQNAGRYEIKAIMAINGNNTVGFTSATPTSVRLAGVSGSYNFSGNTRVQLISFPQLSATNYTTSGNIGGVAWNGNRGGIIAFQVEDTLFLNHNISADGLGFRGGSVSDNNSGPTCVAANSTRYREDEPDLGFKGEGIYRVTNNLYNNGRGRLLNGGGGGSDHNGGGAGGGHYTAGGDGGIGYNNCTAHPSGGFGGLSLSAHIAGNRIFMGGGGGGGQQNNSNGQSGGDGGGIILIKAGVISTSSCAGRTITSDGESPSDDTNDGGGGGGAGGTVMFDVGAWAVNSACPIAIRANGGDGSSSLSGGVHAGGGGGGQGVIIFNDAAPTANVTYQTNNGSPGCGGNGNPCPSFAGSPSGTDSSGVISNTGGPLGVELIGFYLRLENEGILLDWHTASEVDNDYFLIQKSADGKKFENIGKIKGAGNSSVEQFYSFYDSNILGGTSYYRLKQTDYSGMSSYSKIRTFEHNNKLSTELCAYPNPSTNTLHVVATADALDKLEVYNIFGQRMDSFLEHTRTNENHLVLKLDLLPRGNYYLKTPLEVLHFVKK